MALLQWWNQSNLQKIISKYIGSLKPTKTNNKKVLILAFQIGKIADSAIYYKILIGNRVVVTTIYNWECRMK